MKTRVLLTALLALAGAAHAQRSAPLAAALPGGSTNPPIEAWAQAVGPIFAHVDRGQVPSGIL